MKLRPALYAAAGVAALGYATWQVPSPAAVIVQIDADGVIRFDTRPLAVSALTAAARAHSQVTPQPTVRLRVDAARPAADVIAVVDALGAGGIHDIVVDGVR